MDSAVMNNCTIEKRGRFWAVRDSAGELVCLCVYKCGALEVIRRLQAANRSVLRESAPLWPARNSMDSLGHSERSTLESLTFGQNTPNTNERKTDEKQIENTERNSPSQSDKLERQTGSTEGGSLEVQACQREIEARAEV